MKSSSSAEAMYFFFFFYIFCSNISNILCRFSGYETICLYMISNTLKSVIEMCVSNGRE